MLVYVVPLVDLEANIPTSNIGKISKCNNTVNGYEQ